MRLNQITAPAHDLAASIAFYETLGLILIVRSDHYARFECPRGEATFSLHRVDGPIPQANGVQIYFETLDVAEEVARLKQAGLAFEAEAQDQRWLWREAWLRLGPYDLHALLTIMEIEWPDLRARQHDAITAFASSAEARLVF